MIASQHITRSFGAALSYNLRKLLLPDDKGRAELLYTNFSRLDKAHILKEVQLLRSLRPELRRYAYHTSLNFPAEDAGMLDNDKLLSMAQDYLAGMGYGQHPCLIFRHYDAGHPHIHLLACRIGFDGNVVSDSNNYQRSEALVRRLEESYGVTKVQGSRQAQRRAPTKNELEKGSRTKTPSGKLVLQELLSALLSGNNRKANYKPTLSAFISQGEQLGISFLFNQSTTTGRISGVTYFYEDFKCTGKALGRQFGWNQLLTQINYEQDRDEPAVSAANRRTQSKYGFSRLGGTAKNPDTQRSAAATPENSGATGYTLTAADHRAAGGGGDHRAYRDPAFDAGKRHADGRLSTQGGEQHEEAGRRTEPASEAGVPDSAAADRAGTDAAGDAALIRSDVHPDRAVPGVDIALDEDDALQRRRRRARSR